MFKQKENLKLSDLIDINLLQQLQDFFAKSLNIASIILDENGPVTKCSNYTEFCKINIDNNISQEFDCEIHDPKWGKIAFEKKEPLIYKCKSGLTSFVVPIVVQEKYFGAVAGGQVFSHSPNEKTFREFAKKNNIDEELYINLLKQVRVLTKEELDHALSLLTVLANTINEICHKNLKLIEKNQMEALYKSIITTIRRSLDIEEIKQEVVTQIGKFLNADRVVITYYDYDLENYTITQAAEYRSSEEVKTFIGFPFTDFPGFNDAIRTVHFQGKDIIFNDLEKYLDENNLRNTPIEKFYRDFDFTSSVAINMYYENVFLGDFVITFKDKREFSDDEIQFLKLIAEQIGVAFHQAELYQKEKESYEKEKTLREIMLISSSTFDFEKIINSIVTAIGQMLRADRCFYIELDPSEEKFFPIQKYAEYLSSNNIKSHTDIIVEKGETDFFLKQSKQSRITLVEDVEKIRLPKASKNMIVDKLGVKSYAIFPVYYTDIMYGGLVLHYVNNYLHLSTDEVETAQSLSNQTAIIIHQIKLYEEAQKTAKRENLIRNIIELSRSSLDINEVKQKITELLGKAFNADRCYFRSYNKTEDTFSKAQAEYIGKSGLQSLADIEPDNEAFRYFVKALNERKQAFYPLVMDENYVKNTPIEKYMEKVNIKADYAIPIVDRQEELLWLLLHYSEEDPHLSEDDLHLLETIAYQIDIAFEQIRLYNTLKKTAEREALLREIISTIRSSLNIQEIKQKIVEMICKVFCSDRCFLVEYDIHTGKFLTIENESLSSDSIQPYVHTDINENVPNFAKVLKEGKLIVIKNRKITINGEPQDFEKEQEVIKDFNVISAYGFPISYNNELMGVLGLHYINYDNDMSEDDINLMIKISEQMAVALYQAKLYNTIMQITANQNAILNNMPFMSWLKDKNSKFLAVNNEFVKTTGSTLINILGKTDHDFFPKEMADLYVEEDKQVMNIKQTISSVDLVPGEDGKKWRETFKSPVFDSKGNVVGTAGFSRDVTEEKEAQSELIKKQKEILQAKERESLLREIIEDIRGSFDINIIKNRLVNALGKAFEAERCFLVTINKENNTMYIDEHSEYKTEGVESSFVNLNTEAPDVHWFIDSLKKRREFSFYNIDDFLKENNLVGSPEENFLRKYSVQSTYNVPIYYGENTFGYVVVEYLSKQVKLEEASREFLRTVAAQAGIAFYRALLFEQNQLQAQRQAFLSKIVETVGGSLDLEPTLNAICKEIFDLFKADRVAVENYPNVGEYSHWQVTAQYKSGPDILGVLDIDFPAATKTYLGNRLLEEGKDIVFNDINKTDLDDVFIDTHKKMGVKSLMAVGLRAGGEKWGVLVLSQVRNYRTWTNEEIQLLKTVANQSGIAIRQAELYSKVKLQAEKEKFARNIIEILRSTMNKNMIKNLFVKYIGKFFQANRVFFCEYDQKNKRYISSDRNSEYLSDFEQKSFAGFDWTNEALKEYTQPLTDKREIIIPCWEEYKSTHYKSSGFISRFEDFDIKANYSFPVLYQENVIGFFSISFTDECIRLPEEDINMIRNICMQAGIALFHADLYVEAKESAQSKESFIANISKEIQSALKNAIESAVPLSRPDYDKETQMEYSRKLNENIKELTELRNNIISISEIETEGFNLNYEQIEAESFIKNILTPLKHLADEKNILFETDLLQIQIQADRKGLSKAIYNLLINIISLTPAGGHITIKTSLENSKFKVSIKDLGEKLDFYSLNVIFETLKRIDTSFKIRMSDINLGLSVAKKLIEMHNGCIHVDSMEDNGTDVNFTIPCDY